MKRYFYSAILITSFFFSCKKPSKLEPSKLEEELNNLTAFEVTVLDREPTYANLEWSKSIDLSGDSVTYSIEVSGKEVASNIKRTDYKLENLLSNQAYKGRVIAVNKKGLSKADSFTVSPYQDITLFLVDGYGGGLYCLGFGDRHGYYKWDVGTRAFGVAAFNKDTIYHNDASGLFALNAQTGSKLWSTNRSNPEAALLYYQNRIFFSAGNYINAINALNGAQAWEIELENVQKNPSISKGILYTTSADHLYAIDIRNGSKKWDFQALETVSPPIAKDGTAYFLTAERSFNFGKGYLYAVDVNTGLSKWKYRFDGQIDFVGSPVVYNNIVFFISRNRKIDFVERYLYAINTSTGTLVWKTTLPDKETSGFIVDESGIYLYSHNALMKYKRQDGTQLWLSNGKFGGELTVAKNKVFIRSGSSGVTMFNATTGAKLETINTVTFYKFPSGSSFVVLMDGKAYYPPSSGMNTTN